MRLLRYARNDFKRDFLRVHQKLKEMVQMYEFSFPTRTVLGIGSIERIGEFLPCKEHPGNAMLVTGSGKWRSTLNEKIKNMLAEAGWKDVVVFDGIRQNPTRISVKEGVKLCRECSVKTIVAVGGGSPMDAGKIIAKEAGVDLLVTVPTTAGSGSEISPWAVITDAHTREKQSLIGTSPTLAILDPGLTLSLPPKSTLFTGVDAFSHALESYVSKEANSLTDSLALMAIQLIAENLSKAVENGQDIEARTKMLEGNLLAGMAMLYAGLGLIHAIANPAGGLYHELEHGLIIGNIMANVNEFNRPANLRKYQKIEKFIKIVENSIDASMRKLNIPMVEIQERDVALLIEKCMNNLNAATNPRCFTPADIEAIIRDSFNLAKVHRRFSR